MRLLKSPLETALWIALLLAPLVIGLAWGAVFDDGAYVTFRCARNLAAGCGLTHDLTVDEAPAYSPSLRTVVGAGGQIRAFPAANWPGFERAGMGGGGYRGLLRWPGDAVGLEQSAPGFSPAVVSTLGTEASWAVALAWVAVAATLLPRRRNRMR